MKKAIILSVIMILAFSLQTFAEGKKTEVIKFRVDQMTCNGCKAKVTKNITYEKGVTDLTVDLDTKLVTITYRPDKTNEEKLKEAFTKMGYEAIVVKDKEEEAKTE